MQKKCPTYGNDAVTNIFGPGNQTSICHFKIFGVQFTLNNVPNWHTGPKRKIDLFIDWIKKISMETSIIGPTI